MEEKFQPEERQTIESQPEVYVSSSNNRAGG